MTPVDLIKSHWTLAAMCERCGIHLPHSGKFRSPFRPDNTPSCEVYEQTIRDRSRGESYDIIDVFALSHRFSVGDSIRMLAGELQGKALATDKIIKMPKGIVPIEQQKKSTPEKQKLVIPPLHYSEHEADELAVLRGLSPKATEMAGKTLGTLGFGTVAGFRSWILTDANERIAQARRMDGELYPAVRNVSARKSHNIRGSRASWPVGMNPPKAKVPDEMSVLLVEGGPDYLAACDILVHPAVKFLPVAMLGSAPSIHAEAMPFFKGRKVLILAHPDQAGVNAAKNWSMQLLKAGANPKAMQLEGGDLCDLVKLHGAATVASELSI